jgi:acyl transferase domain-containing protein
MLIKDDQEPIAIIGAACRLSGEVSSLGTLWDMISNARTGHCKVPEDRWDGDKLFHPDPDRKGTVSSIDIPTSQRAESLTHGVIIDGC